MSDNPWREKCFLYLCKRKNIGYKVADFFRKHVLRVIVIVALSGIAAPAHLCAMDRDDFEKMKKLVLSTISSDTIEAMSRYKTAADSLRHLHNITPKQLYSLLNKYGPALLHDGRHAGLINFYQPILAIFERQTKLDDIDLEEKLRIYVCLGAALEEIGMKNIAMDCYMRGIDEADRVPRIKAMLLNNIAVVYTDAHLNDKALEYFSEALEINLQLKNNRELQLNYNNLAAIYDELGDVDKAIDCQLSALQYLDKKKSTVDFYDAQIALGALYMHQKRYDIAHSYLRNSLSQQEKQNYVPGIIAASMELANLYVEMNETDSAAYYARKAYDVAHRSNMYAIEVQMLNLCSQIALKTGKPDIAYDLLLKAIQLKDSISDADNQHRLVEWERVFDIERNRPQESTLYETWQVALICLAIITLLAVISVLLYRKASARHRARVLKVINSGRRGNAQLNSEVERLSGLLTAHSINDMQLREQIKDLSEELRTLLQEISPRDRATRQHIQSILKKFRGLDPYNGHEEFKYIFEQANRQFYSALKQKHPDLTSRQTRICAMIYLGLSTKEIAGITFRETRSVDSSRNRLRKKLGLDPKVDLYSYLVQLANGSHDEQGIIDVNAPEEQ